MGMFVTASSVAPAPTMPDTGVEDEAAAARLVDHFDARRVAAMPIEPGVAHGTEPRTPQKRTRMRRAYYAEYVATSYIRIWSRTSV